MTKDELQAHVFWNVKGLNWECSREVARFFYPLVARDDTRMNSGS